MIKWNNLDYSYTSAENDFKLLNITSKSVTPIDQTPEFQALRMKLIQARDEVFENFGLDTADKLDYQFDLSFGLKLYKIFQEDKDFNNRFASSDDIWRFISIKIIPDIVHSRHDLKADYFYKNPRRIWLKRIFWYIHLSWAGDEISTFNRLKNNSTDTIQNLVERPGLGYHVDLYREIMKQYRANGHNVDLFRRLMKLNTAREVVFMPEFYQGGLVGYVRDLFELARG
ncbi:hypothetical protein HZY86_03305 [Aerococcaceae bacterium DSM 111020]|nr:hypothetical protein [Aerococcaceae bacterium DSM 111020]